MSFSLPDLPYAYDALQPFMSKETLEYHHDKHHKAYLDAMTPMIANTPYAALPQWMPAAWPRLAVAAISLS